MGVELKRFKLAGSSIGRAFGCCPKRYWFESSSGSHLKLIYLKHRGHCVRSKVLDILKSYRCEFNKDRDGDSTNLEDVLSPGSTIKEGLLELELLSHYISEELFYQNVIYILCGLPASGKTTWRNKKIEDKSLDVVCFDDIRSIIFGHQFHQEAEPHIVALGKSMAEMLVRQGRSLIIDTTGLTHGLRSHWIKLAQKNNFKSVVVWFDTSVEECIKRNLKRDSKVPEDVIIRMNNGFISPDQEFENFDELIIVKEE